MEVAASFEPCYDSGDVGLGAVLAEFFLRIDSGDDQLDSDNCPELTGDEFLGRIIDRPGML